VPYIALHPANLTDKHAKLSEQPTIHDGCVIIDSNIGAWTELGRNTMLVESSFGDYSYTAGDVDIIYTDVGKFCSIASHVRINPGNHPMERVTQHHLTYRSAKFGFAATDDETFFDWRRSFRCTIGHDVWIGHGATLMPGVKIGTGAVIGAGAVVTKDIDPYVIAVGVPARPLRTRFSPDVIDKLLRIAWWDWSRELLEQRFGDFQNTPLFVDKYGQA